MNRPGALVQGHRVLAWFCRPIFDLKKCYRSSPVTLVRCTNDTAECSGLLSAVSGPDGKSAEMSPRKAAHIVKRREAQDVGPGIALQSI
jgi:hypothetical protein